MTEVHRLLAGPSQRLHHVPADLLDQVARTGLRGRGGGGFPLARKLAAARDARGRPVVVVNAAEGEPASRKDRTLLERDPHLVLDGARAAAAVVGAREVVVAVHGRSDALDAALAERTGEARVVRLQRGYVRSEASAVVSALTGGDGLPFSRTRPLAHGGPGGRPWLVSNAETIGGLGLLARHGERWFREVGSLGEPGTLLLTVRGAVRRPRVVEVPVGTAVGAVLEPVKPVQAVLTGGWAGRWLTSAGDVPLSHAGMRAAGGTLGAGLLLVLPDSACGLAATAAVVRALADESARQCGPCVNGLPAIASALTALAGGGTDRAVLDRLARWCGLVTGRGACAHPDGVAALVASALTAFADDVPAHLAGGCGRGADLLDGLSA